MKNIDKILVPYLQKNGKYIYVDFKTMKPVLYKKEYDMAKLFYKELARVGKYDNKGNLKMGVIDKTGKEIIPCKYDDVGEHNIMYNTELIKVKINNKYGFVDKAGNEVIPAKYDGAEGFYDGIAIVEINDCEIYINENGVEYSEIDSDKTKIFKI